MQKAVKAKCEPRFVFIRLSSERVEEFETAQDVLRDMGVPEKELTGQRVVSAAMQTFIAYVQNGGKVTYEFIDHRTAESD